MIIKYINQNNNELDLKDIDVKRFNNISQIYSFTTENIAGYYEQLYFENKKILTIAGSGDHIINAYYKGAKTVIGFDINYLALIYTELKLIALVNLEYEEFLEFFMINEKNDIEKNKNALNYEIYINKLRKFLSKNAINYLDKLYENFNNNGYELRNSKVFNNKYDNNLIKMSSNLYLKSKKEYDYARKVIANKEILLINSNYQNLQNKLLTKQQDYDILIMSNISDYIKDIYLNSSNYLEEYIKELIKEFKKDNNQIICAYIYNMQSTEYRSYIDNPTIRENTFNKLKIKYSIKKFNSVIKNYEDSVIII